MQYLYHAKYTQNIIKGLQIQERNYEQCFYFLNNNVIILGGREQNTVLMSAVFALGNQFFLYLCSTLQLAGLSHMF